MKENENVIPTIFAKSKAEFTKRFNALTKIAKNLQIDFMDGKLVDAKSIKISDIPDLNKFDNHFEAHLMVKDPEKWIFDCKKKGFFRIIFHVEAVSDPDNARTLMEKIHDLRMESYIAINPETPIEKAFTIIEHGVDGILVMGVKPGAEGQELDKNAAERIIKLKKRYPEKIVQIDGGINDKTIESIAKSGADKVNTGSFVSKAKSPVKALEILEKKFI